MKSPPPKDELAIEKENMSWFLFGKSFWLEIGLVLSIVVLFLLAFEQDLTRWWHTPSPGKMGVGYLDENFASSCLAERYLVRLPTSYHQKNTWPLIVFLHGSGKRGNDPKKLDKYLDFFESYWGKELPAVLVMPQCRSEQRWEADDIRALVTIIDQQYHVDSNRVYLMGSSMGGFGAWRTAAAYPDFFAAIIPISGGESIDLADRLLKCLPWAFHGSSDHVVPVERTTDLVEAIRLAGGDPKLTLYPEQRHDIVGLAFSTPELWHWLFEQNLEDRPEQVSVSTTSDKEP